MPSQRRLRSTSRLKYLALQTQRQPDFRSGESVKGIPALLQDRPWEAFGQDSNLKNGPIGSRPSRGPTRCGNEPAAIGRSRRPCLKFPSAVRPLVSASCALGGTCESSFPRVAGAARRRGEACGTDRRTTSPKPRPREVRLPGGPGLRRQSSSGIGSSPAGRRPTRERPPLGPVGTASDTAADDGHTGRRWSLKKRWAE